MKSTITERESKSSKHGLLDCLGKPQLTPDKFWIVFISVLVIFCDIKQTCDGHVKQKKNGILISF
jgi:hypothetical protein